MDCRLLSENDFLSLYGTFKSAFSDNKVHFQPSQEKFRHRVYKKLRIDNQISAGVFDGDSMVGFAIHTSNSYQGVPTAYNGGTGILPGFRNQKIAEYLYHYLIPKIQTKLLVRILLEVVEDNESALKFYEKIGFSFKRKLLCYKQTKKLEVLSGQKIIDGDISEVDFNFVDFEPSFLDSKEHLLLSSEKVLLSYNNDRLVGYLIFQPHSGRISQLAVSRLFRHERIGESLIYVAQNQSKKVLTIMNIPENQVGFDLFLKQCGFENQINQFEMELII